jgi:hypothetical protein
MSGVTAACPRLIASAVIAQVAVFERAFWAVGSLTALGVMTTPAKPSQSSSSYFLPPRKSLMELGLRGSSAGPFAYTDYLPCRILRYTGEPPII